MNQIMKNLTEMLNNKLVLLVGKSDEMQRLRKITGNENQVSETKVSRKSTRSSNDQAVSGMLSKEDARAVKSAILTSLLLNYDDAPSSVDCASWCLKSV